MGLFVRDQAIAEPSGRDAAKTGLDGMYVGDPVATVFNGVAYTGRGCNDI